LVTEQEKKVFSSYQRGKREEALSFTRIVLLSGTSASKKEFWPPAD
jgi:hypothetical protein